MEGTKLDIWAIQSCPEEIDIALDRIVKPSTNILYTNCMSKLKIGGRTFKIEFDTMIHSEENDTLIIVMRGSKLSKEDIIGKLEERNIPYDEVVFSNYEYKDYEEKLKEIWFARDGSALKDALSDSINKGNDIARYYPIVKGKLSFKYPGRPHIKDEEEETPVFTFERIQLRGMIETEDKIVLLVNALEDTNVYYKQALRILSQTGMTPIIENYESFEQAEKAKVKNKK